jgi:ABC-2 type transport system permease protein
MRALRLIAVQLRASLLLALQYRADFLIDGLIELLTVATVIVPLSVVYASRPAVAGVPFEHALIVVGFFTMLQGVVEGAVNPSLVSVVEHVRSGTLDFVLLRPADAQLLVSTSRFLPWRFVNVLTGLAIIVFALVRLHRLPSGLEIGLALLVFGCGIVLLYSFMLMVVTLAFFAGRVDNLAYVVTSLVDAGRWPIGVFRGTLRWIFTFVFPLAVMTTFPGSALLGTLEPRIVALSVGLAATLGFLSRKLFQWALTHYSSASS